MPGWYDRTLDRLGLQRKSLADPDEMLREIFGSTSTAAGISVSPGTAMKSTAVRRAVQSIAEPVGALPLHVYRRDGEARERDTDHPVAKVLRDPNPWTSAQDFREQLQRDALLHGDGLAAITRVDGKPRELIRYKPGALTIDADEFGAPVYKQEGRTIPREDVFHIKAPSLNGVKGESPVNQAREAIAFAILLESHGSRLFSNGAAPGGVIEIPKDVGTDAIGKIRTAWQASHGGENTGKTGVLIDGATYKPTSFTPTDAQYLELRRYAVDEIARVFGVPPSMLFEMGRATWGNAENQSATFLTFTLMRWLRAWQSEIRLKLFTKEERDDWFAEFNSDDLLTVDFAARATAYGQYRSMGAMTGNEVRKGLNLPPLPDGDSLSNPNITTAPPPAANDNPPPDDREDAA